MHGHSLDRWRQPHDFRDHREQAAERRVLIVMTITALTMAIEIAAGHLYGSMALVADGWHMGSHVAAFAIAMLGYVAARRFGSHERFTFGTGKVGPLAGYSSALLLGGVAVAMGIESIDRLLDPVEIRFLPALAVAAIGLAVNLVCAWILRDDPVHVASDDHAHRHASGHGHDHARDHNLAAAYLHVLADALTSLLAIVALAAGHVLGWRALDAVVALVGAAVILHWAAGLARRSGAVLLDAEDMAGLQEKVRTLIEHGGDDRVADLHVWRVGLAAHACIVSVVTHRDIAPSDVKQRLAGLSTLRHVTVEVNRCCA